jgi:hypothetical protein
VEEAEAEDHDNDNLAFLDEEKAVEQWDFLTSSVSAKEAKNGAVTPRRPRKISSTACSSSSTSKRPHRTQAATCSQTSGNASSGTRRNAELSSRASGGRDVTRRWLWRSGRGRATMTRRGHRAL